MGAQYNVLLFFGIFETAAGLC
jgi:hypothetical protein